MTARLKCMLGRPWIGWVTQPKHLLPEDHELLIIVDSLYGESADCVMLASKVKMAWHDGLLLTQEYRRLNQRLHAAFKA